MNEAQAASAGARVCASCGARFPSDALFCPNDGTPLQSAHGMEREEDPYLGQEIAGHIEIQQLVGIGAMGRVYRAFQRGIDRDVAVKVLHRELSANAQLVSRFTREAKVASRLQHPNVVHVIMAGQLPDRALYMAMEFLDGLSLQSAILAAGGSLPLARCLHITLQLCEAVGEAHAQGIVHRDLKPENVMLVRRGSDEDFVKVLDFGIARITWAEQSVATAAGLIFGTARYISPEGAQGNAVGPPSDVYAIATLLYQMLAGRTPFEGEQAVGLLVQQIHDAPPTLRSIPRAAYVPEPIAELVMANLVKDAGRRAPDARTFGEQLAMAAKAAGLSPEEISRPILGRASSAMKLAPLERTRQHELTPEIAARLSPTPASVVPTPAPEANGLGGKAPTPATVKWEPPTEFQAKLAAELANVEAQRSSAPESNVPRARLSSVDATLDDASVPPAPSAPSRAASSPSFPAPTPSQPRTVIEESRPPTQYTPPVAAAMESPRSEPQMTSEPRPTRPPVPSSPPEEAADAPARSRGWLFVLMCFVLGVALAAGVAWKMGKLGGDAEAERVAQRATAAMFQNRFDAPPGENVLDLTTAALRRWPGDRRFLDIRERACRELVAQAIAKRPTDAPEALRLAKLATELDPAEASARRLLEQLEADTSVAPTSSAPPLPSGTSAVKVNPGPPPVPGAVRATIDVTPASPRAGAAAEVSAKVTGKAPLEGAAFVVSGPGLGTPARAAAVLGEDSAYKASFAFPKAGRYELAFVATEGGRPVRVVRSVSVLAAAGAPATAIPPTATAPTTPTAPPTATTPPAPTGSVKWL